MWFKNLQVYRFTSPFTLTPEALSDKLASKPFRPCGSQDISRIGFVSPLPETGEQHEGYDLVHASGGYILLCCKVQQKVLPAAAVNEALEEKVKSVEQTENRRLGRKERQQLKDELTQTMLPKAFTRSSKLYAYIAPKDGYLVVNSASASRAEELQSTLREALGSLPVIPAVSKSLPAQVMTNWLKHQQLLPEFSLGNECELRDPGEDGGIIRCKNQILTSENILNHINEGMFVSKLALVSDAGISCVVDENLAVKRLAYGDRIQEKLDQESADDARAQMDVDFTLMTLELAQFLKHLYAVFGGEDLSACAAEE